MDSVATVYLVGAGPGDPGLMTARALELIATADAILYDRLIPPGALEGASAECELHYVGKQPGGPALEQEQINAQLVELGRSRQRVVRLKGGDPFVFGRGGEEAAALQAAGVGYEVVPGVTAGVAAPAYAGIPVTHRDSASAVAFVTGHEDPEKGSERIDWEALAAFPGTLVVYMGMRSLAAIAERLVAAGRDPRQPAAVVARGTHPDQRVVAGELADIAERVADAGLGAPAIVVVGQAAALREQLAWIERRPLHGRRVAVTRARAQASELAARLRTLGAEVVETPAIRIEPLPIAGDLEAALGRFRGDGSRGEDAYALVCLTSPNGAELLFDALAARGLDARALAGTALAAIGSGTVRELERHGVRADVTARRPIAEALAEALADFPVGGRRVLLAGAARMRDALPNALRERGALVDVVALYETVAEALSEERRAALARADYVTFASGSAVRSLLAALGTDRGAIAGARVVSIGPVTSAAAREQGLAVDIEAARHDIDGLLEALLEDASGSDGQNAGKERDTEATA